MFLDLSFSMDHEQSVISLLATVLSYVPYIWDCNRISLTLSHITISICPEMTEAIVRIRICYSSPQYICEENIFAIGCQWKQLKQFEIVIIILKLLAPHLIIMWTNQLISYFIYLTIKRQVSAYGQPHLLLMRQKYNQPFNLVTFLISWRAPRTSNPIFP